MKKLILTFIFLPIWLFSQNNNCEAFLYKGDSIQYNACKLIENIGSKYGQFSREFQQTYDSAIYICPYFAVGYREKSVAYLKSGDFITWKQLIDKAVEFDPKGNLGYRGWCRFQFFRDYEGAIFDIEALEKLNNFEIGTSQNGDYHLKVVKAICYSALNKKKQGISILNNLLNSKNYSPMNYDYYQLGVMYYEINNIKLAKKAFINQKKLNDFADNEYYLAKTLKTLKETNKSFIALNLAKKLFEKNTILYDPYTHHFKCVYVEQINKALSY